MEIGYAVVTGALLAAALFCLVGAPVLVLGLEGAAQRALLIAASAAAAVGFLARVVRVLWRFDGGAAAAAVGVRQPSQPGRTRPDS
ncbi:DUF6332 family protein [Streptomyces sp. TRM64462]|uniref:DUF6332 family protein n=1 Tax=Streptomyces sp. TRM64462 TaxID=2741726 RepID=UPI00158626CA|nr:DUF6332 family protein [Streptomyces sp. TRM64462]